MPKVISVSLLAVLFACSDPADDSGGDETQSSGLSGKKIYQMMCSTCHGDNGDGHGIVMLKTKPRSFIEGGFAFGNTPEAVFRTISSGIGGTQMPGFGHSLSETERHAVTAYVLSLNPENLRVRPGNPVMKVVDIPLVVRGHLPSVADGVPERPRGLLVGTLDGLSWEYRADDLRLLAVRKGEFVERSDWGGRGGTPLTPLGEVIWLNQNGNPSAPWKLITTGGEQVLRARLVGTTVSGGKAIIRARLVGPSGEDIGEVEMWGSSRLVDGAIKPQRNFRFVGFNGSHTIQYEDLRVPFIQSRPVEFSK